MRIHRFLIPLCLLTASCAVGERSESHTATDSDAATLSTDAFAPGWTRSGMTRTYLADDLYGHINGGAELFKEFGFQSLDVRNWLKGEDELTLEIYRMNHPVGALGIYLAQVGDEKPVAGLSARHSWNRYQLSLIKGECFVQINNFSGDASLLSDVRALAERALGEIPDRAFVDPFATMPERDLVPGSLRLFRGPLALEPIYTLGRGDVLQLAGETFGVVGEYRQTGLDPFVRIRIDYPAGQALNVITHLRANHDRYLECVMSSDEWLLFEDYQGRYVAVTRVMSSLEVLLKLNDKPWPPAPGYWLFGAD